MKTLKQIREELDDSLLQNVEFTDEVMLEAHGSTKPETQIPSVKQMPTMLLFRRITYRTYPKGQVVALYYSKMVDKYLSIPYGPGGNLNLSEAVVLDEEQLDEFLPPLIAGAVASGAARAAAGAVAKKALGWAGDKLKKAFTGGDDSKQQPQQQQQQAPEPAKTAPETHKPALKTDVKHIEKSNKGDAVYQSKMKQASLKSVSNPSVNENKITDIRKMVKENIDSKDIYINGRQVTLNTSMAKRILEVYDSVNTKNKKIVEGMLNEDLESFKKLLNFSIRN